MSYWVWKGRKERKGWERAEGGWEKDEGFRQKKKGMGKTPVSWIQVACGQKNESLLCLGIATLNKKNPGEKERIKKKKEQRPVHNTL